MGENCGYGTVEFVVSEIDELEADLRERRDLSGELIALHPEEKKLGQFGERGGNVAGEGIVGEDDFLEGGHAEESVVGDSSVEAVVGEEEGLEGPELADIRHVALEVVVLERDGA